MNFHKLGNDIILSALQDDNFTLLFQITDDTDNALLGFLDVLHADIAGDLQVVPDGLCHAGRHIGEELVGDFLVGCLEGEHQVSCVAVAQEARGRGIGKGVTLELMQYAANMGVQYMTLEVRKSNLVAQNLYKSVGFIELGVRKRYYEDNGEDALIMVCDHLPEADPDFEEEGTIHE